MPTTKTEPVAIAGIIRAVVAGVVGVLFATHVITPTQLEAAIGAYLPLEALLSAKVRAQVTPYVEPAVEGVEQAVADATPKAGA